MNRQKLIWKLRPKNATTKSRHVKIRLRQSWIRWEMGCMETKTKNSRNNRKKSISLVVSRRTRKPGNKTC